MSKIEILDVGPNQQVIKETLPPKKGKRPATTIYHPMQDTGERPRLRIPGITETKEAFEQFQVLSALGGVACAAIDQPRNWRTVTVGGVRQLRTETAVSGINYVNEKFDNRGVVAIAHSLGGVDMAHAGQELTPDVVPEVVMEAVAGVRKNTLPEMWVNAEIGGVAEVTHMAPQDCIRYLGRVAKGSPLQLSAEGLYGSTAHTEDMVRTMGRKGMKVAFTWGGKDLLIPPDSNLAIKGENIRSLVLPEACHNMATCMPEQVLDAIDDISRSYITEGAVIEQVPRQSETTDKNRFVLTA